jgi:hypothetical protein
MKIPMQAAARSYGSKTDNLEIFMSDVIRKRRARLTASLSRAPRMRRIKASSVVYACQGAS